MVEKGRLISGFVKGERKRGRKRERVNKREISFKGENKTAHQ